MFKKKHCHGCKKTPREVGLGMVLMKRTWWGRIKVVYLCTDCSTSPDHYDSAVEKVLR